MLFRMLYIVLEQLAKIHKGFPRSEFGRERIVDRWQDLLLDLAHGNGVIRFFACQFLDRKICREFHDRQARFARLCPTNCSQNFGRKLSAARCSQNFLPPCKFLLACGAISLIGLLSIEPSKSSTAKSPICSPRPGTSTKSADCSRRRSSASSISASETFVSGNCTGIFL